MLFHISLAEMEECQRWLRSKERNVVHEDMNYGAGKKPSKEKQLKVAHKLKINGLSDYSHSRLAPVNWYNKHKIFRIGIVLQLRNYDE